MARRPNPVTAYRVQCQSASGQATTITVRAETDEGACRKALAELNSWRPVRVMPAIPGEAPTTGVTGFTAPVEAAVVPIAEETAVEPRFGLVHRPSLTELVEQHRGRCGVVGAALLAATARSHYRRS